MRLFFKIIPAVLALILLLLCFPSCGKNYNEVQFDPAKNMYRDAVTGKSYMAMPPEYQPIAKGDQYAVLKMDKTEYPLYIIEGLDPETYLATEDGTVLTTQVSDVPSVTQLNVTEIALLTTGETPILTGKLTSEEDIQSVIRALSGDGSIERPLTSAAATYTLAVRSSDYPGIQYAVRYLIYDEDVTAFVGEDEVETNVGKNLLYDIYSRQCFTCPDLLTLVSEDN